MAIGMTYDEYWYGDPMMVRAFYKADQLRKKRADEDAWLHGLYVMSALNATVGNMFRKPGQTPAEYPKEPYTVKEERERQRRMDEAAKEQEAAWAYAWMNSFVQAGKNFGKAKKEKG